jgi:hypothetical protein
LPYFPNSSVKDLKKRDFYVNSPLDIPPMLLLFGIGSFLSNSIPLIGSLKTNSKAAVFFDFLAGFCPRKVYISNTNCYFSDNGSFLRKTY